MTQHDVTTTVERYVKAWAARDRATLAEVVADDVVAHGAGGHSTAGFASFAEALLDQPFDVLSLVVHDLIVTGDRAAIRYELLMRQTQPMLGVPPSDAEIRGRGIQICHVREGRIAQMWVQTDMLGLFAQLGIREMPAALFEAAGETHDPRGA